MLINIQKELKNLAKINNLTHQHIADILGVSLELVDAWFAKPTSAGFRKVRPHYIELLRFKLEDRNRGTEKRGE